MNRPTNDFNKLPKWARDYIGSLERGFADAHKRLAVYENRNPTNTYGYRHMDERVPLQPNANVRFELGERSWIDVRINTDFYNNPALEITANYGLLVTPGAANRIYLREPK